MLDEILSRKAWAYVLLKRKGERADISVKALQYIGGQNITLIPLLLLLLLFVQVLSGKVWAYVLMKGRSKRADISDMILQDINEFGNIDS